MTNELAEEQILAQRLVTELAAAGKQLVTVESCTGGRIAAAITRIPGASKVFGYGLVTYANAAKTDLIGVSPELLDIERGAGAVSSEVAAAMAEGGLKLGARDYALSVTGNAGPGGGSASKPVGLVYFGLARSGAATLTQARSFTGDREAIRSQATIYGLALVLRAVVGDEGFEPPTPSV
ncbi:MAG: CinA family protein [Alphaproteobacteria bacterium]|nr:CinA family protein [Alphaproteobacteria bacterium]